VVLLPDQVVEELVSNVTVIEKLTFFDHKDANGKDWGLNVRQRAKELVALINDPERMRAERHKVSKPGLPSARCVSP
jgi:epsin